MLYSARTRKELLAALGSHIPQNEAKGSLSCIH